MVGVANARDGFVYAEEGLDLKAFPSGGSTWPSAIEGLRATEADVLVEVTASPAADGEPGLTHMREALERGIPVVTSNKWPVALHGVELAELARDKGVQFRAESTVMSGTPVLSTFVEGLAGATPLALRGLLNATANFILTRMAEGTPYEAALAEAQAAGLAERDPTDDVEGNDTVAKLMILSALVFGRQLRREDVACRGITDLEPGTRAKHVATLDFAEPAARVQPEVLDEEDPLARIDGTTNAAILRADPVGEITVIGPGAGPELAGQGVLSDLLAVMRGRRTESG